MAIDPALQEFLLTRLAPLGEVRLRRMFGGAGIYLGGRMFGLISRNVIYFKVDAGNLQDYEDAGAEPFVPFAERPYPMSYRRVPEAVLADGPTLVAWAKQAAEAAGRAAAKRGKRR